MIHDILSCVACLITFYLLANSIMWSKAFCVIILAGARILEGSRVPSLVAFGMGIAQVEAGDKAQWFRQVADLSSLSHL